jgi:hypothetical protein
MSARKVQLTVRVEAEVVRAAKERAGHMKMSVSAAIAEAAKESLLSSYRSERETEILKAVERNFQALRGFERRVEFELRVMKEMLGLGMRSFFNHTPAVPEPDKSAALLSGKIRFGRYLDLLARNLHAGGPRAGQVGGAAQRQDSVRPVSRSFGSESSRRRFRSGGSPTPGHRRISGRDCTAKRKAKRKSRACHCRKWGDRRFVEK